MEANDENVRMIDVFYEDEWVRMTVGDIEVKLTDQEVLALIQMLAVSLSKKI